MSKKTVFIYFLCLFIPFAVVLLLRSLGFLNIQPEPLPQESTVTLYRHNTQQTVDLPLTDYLWGVVAGEMPASYPQEALKAQVVASYSYLLHRINTIQKHPASDFGHAGDVCDDPNHCKAWLSPDEAILKWGKDWYDASFDRIAQAVQAVQLKALYYDGEPANTVFHAISGGKTENAADVWGAEVPYLQSVDSHWDREAKGFASKVQLSRQEFCEKLQQTDCSPGAVTLTEGGSVASMVIGSNTFTGRQLRTLFNLRSTRFTLAVDREQVTFTVSGYGHQVGMSQYGASVLAQSGYSYDQILLYYYPGTVLTDDCKLS